MLRSKSFVALFSGIILSFAGAAWGQTSASAVSGFNPNAPRTPIDVAWEGEHWHLLVDLIFDPGSGFMEKSFETPNIGTLIQPGQTFPLWEEFQLLDNPNYPVPIPVSDWHEELLTPGWIWGEIPGESLITKNGQPWPWQPIPMPPDPSKIWVEFPPIFPPDILDVHKLLIWQGTADNSIWGDGINDDGSIMIDESVIRAIEYPTPEPATAALLCLGTLAILGRRR